MKWIAIAKTEGGDVIGIALAPSDKGSQLVVADVENWIEYHAADAESQFGIWMNEPEWFYLDYGDIPALIELLQAVPVPEGARR